MEQLTKREKQLLKFILISQFDQLEKVSSSRYSICIEDSTLEFGKVDLKNFCSAYSKIFNADITDDLFEDRVINLIRSIDQKG
jgi:hypothetical protein